MHDWNVVVSTHEGRYQEAWHFLQEFGPLARTDFFNILVMRVTDIPGTLEMVREKMGREPEGRSFVSRFMPLERCFTFQSPAEFEEKAKEAGSAWLPDLAGRSFHVRIHRRGFKGKMSSMEEEKMLDEYLLQTLQNAGTSGRITFDDPDFIIAAETAGPRAGFSLWNREELARYPFLHLD
ncbi:MAG: hypothetical protein HYS23_07615 [Geobacter sp.]|nr:hypothetical protein [Geobacter sp.]